MCKQYVTTHNKLAQLAHSVMEQQCSACRADIGVLNAVELMWRLSLVDLVWSC